MRGQVARISLARVEKLRPSKLWQTGRDPKCGQFCLTHADVVIWMCAPFGQQPHAASGRHVAINEQLLIEIEKNPLLGRSSAGRATLSAHRRQRPAHLSARRRQRPAHRRQSLTTHRRQAVATKQTHAHRAPPGSPEANTQCSLPVIDRIGSAATNSTPNPGGECQLRLRQLSATSSLPIVRQRDTPSLRVDRQRPKMRC